MEKLEILSKYDNIPETGNEFEDNRLGSARIACGILKKMAEMNEQFYFNFALIIAFLSRKALLTIEERTAVFGKGVIENGLFQLVFEGNQDAIVISMLERMDCQEFLAAAKLAKDITGWHKIAGMKLDEFLLTKAPDAVVLCLLANRCGGVQYIDDDIQEMEAVARKEHPNIEKLFELVINMDGK